MRLWRCARVRAVYVGSGPGACVVLCLNISSTRFCCWGMGSVICTMTRSYIPVVLPCCHMARSNHYSFVLRCDRSNVRQQQQQDQRADGAPKRRRRGRERDPHRGRLCGDPAVRHCNRGRQRQGAGGEEGAGPSARLRRSGQVTSNHPHPHPYPHGAQWSPVSLLHVNAWSAHVLVATVLVRVRGFTPCYPTDGQAVARCMHALIATASPRPPGRHHHRHVRR